MQPPLHIFFFYNPKHCNRYKVNALSAILLTYVLKIYYVVYNEMTNGTGRVLFFPSIYAP